MCNIFYCNVYITGVAKHETLKFVKDEPPNDTNVEEALKKIKDNDSSFKEVNFNNLKVRKTKVQQWHSQ